jgi:YidC/Oxa1 family membrane protein insertase
MEQRRFLLFVSLSLLIWLGWINFVVPKFFPPPPKPVRGPAQLADEADAPPADALWPENVPVAAPQPAGVPKHPRRTVTLGSLDPNSDFFLHVELTTLGAAVRTIELNDPRYPEFGNRGKPLKVVGSNPHAELLTFETAIPDIDRQLPLGGNRLLDWEFIENTHTNSRAEFRLLSPDGRLEVVKRYELKTLPVDQLQLPGARDRLFEGYELVLTIELQNHSRQQADVAYSLQGPVGLPLEDAENSSKYRDLRLGFLEPDGSLDPRQMSAAEVFDKDAQGKIELWKRPLKYIGVDVKYFAALVQPAGDQLQSPTVATTQAQLVQPAAEKKFSDISVVLNSVVRLDPAGSADDHVQHQYVLFAGPKRQELLAAVGAENTVDFGYVNVIARVMLWMLNLFHSMGVSYGVAIILLTVVVRGAMFPVSRHQAHNMQRMKELQPKIKEIQAKYAGNKEELARAQMELFRKHNYNPLSGCLPLLLQLPIFIGLYTALSSAVDLRMVPFLWFDNLAAPDALFPLPFKVPFFGWTEFNLLPVISTALMFFQQKMMMPPPADEEQAMQQKMMNFMMIFMGVLFYRVPSGLCVYFISSSVWGMVERWLLNTLQKPSETTPVAAPPAERAAAPSASPSRLQELWSRLQQAADKDVSITRTTTDLNSRRNGKKRKR